MSSNGKRYGVTPEAFVRAWQSSSTSAEVAAKINMPAQSVRCRASLYRKKGIPLKEMDRGPGRRPLDVTALAALARELAPGAATTAPAPKPSAPPAPRRDLIARVAEKGRPAPTKATDLPKRPDTHARAF